MVSYYSTQTTIEVFWSKMTGAVSYSYELYRGTSASGSPVDSAYNFTINATSVESSGLSPGTAYYIKFWGRMSNGSNQIEYAQAYTDSAYVPPPSSPTNLRVYDRGPGFLGVTWNSVYDANGYSIEIYHSATGTLTASDYGFSGTSKVMYGLTSGVSYDIKVWAFNDGGNSSGAWLRGQKAGNTRPSNWTLFDNYTSGQSASIPATTWNNFVTRIKDFYTYRDLNPTLFSFTSASSGQPITATQINQARSAINYLGPSTGVPASVGSGGTAMASTVRNLQLSLNSVT